MYCCVLIDWIPSIGVALYIYRVGWTYPTRNPVYRSKSIKILNCTRTPFGPVEPVWPTGQTGWSCQTGYSITYQSDYPGWPVRPVGLVCCQFWSSTYASLFFGKACGPKNTLLDQNCLKAMINDTSAIFCAKSDKNYRPRLVFFKLMMKQLA